MIRLMIIFATAFAGSAAQAHPGHLSELAGHGHWLGAAAIGAAVAIGLWAAVRGRKAADTGAADIEETGARQEA